MEHADMQNNENISEETTDFSNEDISDIDEHIRSFFEDDNPGRSDPVIIDTSLMPEIKGLELLKKAGSSLNISRTINDMFSIIKSMEFQLKNVLTINTSLQRDLNASKEAIEALKAERSRLNNVISEMEDAIPSKRALQAEIDHMIEERNSVQPRLRDMKREVEDMNDKVNKVERRINELEEEKSDLLKEIRFLEAKADAASRKESAYKIEIATLRGEQLLSARKMRSLENESMKYREENERLGNDVRESRKAIDEIQNKLEETKVQAKKSFYKSGKRIEA